MHNARAFTCGRFSAGFDGLLGLVEGLGQAARLGQDLGAGHAVLRIAGLDADRLGGRRRRLLVLLAWPPARGCAANRRGRCRVPASAPAPSRGGSGRSGSSSVVSARSTNGSAVIGSRMICVTFIEALPGSLLGSNANSTPRSG